MKKKLRIQQRLILPIILLGVVAFISNVLSIFSINNVNSNASKIVDNYMVGSETLQNIRHSITKIHEIALSHIVAADYNTMITIVGEIKEEEETLETFLKEYKNYITEEEEEIYAQLLKNYDSFKHALVFLVCASADSKTTEAYAYANGDVASFGTAMENNADELVCRRQRTYHYGAEAPFGRLYNFTRHYCRIHHNLSVIGACRCTYYP